MINPQNIIVGFLAAHLIFLVALLWAGGIYDFYCHIKYNRCAASFRNMIGLVIIWALLLYQAVILGYIELRILTYFTQ